MSKDVLWKAFDCEGCHCMQAVKEMSARLRRVELTIYSGTVLLVVTEAVRLLQAI